MAKTIIVGISADGSSDGAAPYAARLAQSLNTTLTLVFGYDASSLGPRGGPLEEQLAEIAGEITTEVRDRLLADFPTLEINVELVRDQPVESLMRAFEALDAELVVVGHGGGGPLRAALLGGTTYQLVHRAPFPVLVVPDLEE
jgi:nucleotide-binding universal stress UspA family protein